MSFDTEKRKIQRIWEDSQRNSNKLEAVTLIQDKKKTQISLSLSNSIKFNEFRSFNSEWIPMQIMSLQPDGSYDFKAVSFQIDVTLPEELIPYARLNLAYRRVDGADVFLNNAVIFNQFTQVINATSRNEFGLPIGNTEGQKHVIWNVGFSVEKFSEDDIKDFEVKLLFTLLNPRHFTAS